MPDTLLALNAGSSSIKFALYRVDAGRGPSLAGTGQVEAIGTAPHLRVVDAGGRPVAERRWAEGGRLGHEALFEALFGEIERQFGADRLIAAGHRIVHGGDEFAAPVLLSEDVLRRLDALVPLAPLHQPHNLAAIRALAAVRPHLSQVACFDTAFHHAMPAVARQVALPRHFGAEGVRRYGFHGLSYEYIAGELPRLLPQTERAVVAHLGNGASLCALKAGRSIETTMSFTPLDGLVMGTRCGALDPGIVLFLLNRGMNVSEVEDLLYHRSGLLGVSGISGDMRTLLASPAATAREAVDLFAYRCASQVAALAAALGGLDALVFTAGIGEHAPPVRALICERLAWLGIALDAAANERGDRHISTRDSRVAVLVVPTDEQLMIARHTLAVLGKEEQRWTSRATPQPES
jgi:acetate kinase